MPGGFFVIGIYIEGSTIYGGITDFDGNLFYSINSIIEKTYSAEAVITKIKEIIYKIIDNAEIEKEDILGIGIGFPGPVDINRNMIICSPHMKCDWQYHNIRDILEKEFDKPVAVDNNANAYMFGEWLRGVGIDYDNMVCIIIGKGIGGSLMNDGNIIYGENGFAGEFGHMTIVKDGRKCNCGKTGCLETYASLSAMEKQCANEIMSHTDSLIWQLAEKDISNVKFPLIVNAFKKGDYFAAEIIEKGMEYLAAGISNLIGILNPFLIILGGELSKYQTELYEVILSKTKEHSSFLPTHKVKIAFSQLGSEAGILGAAGLAKLTIAVRHRNQIGEILI